MDWNTLLFSFSGRVNRGKYWLSVLITFVAMLVIMIPAFAISGMLGQDAGRFLILAAFLVFGLVALWIGLAVGMKRLHDRDKSGWWMLLFYFVPIMLNSIGETSGDVFGLALAAVGFAISVWGFVELGCLKGTTGPNTYGPDPLSA